MLNAQILNKIFEMKIACKISKKSALLTMVLLSAVNFGKQNNYYVWIWCYVQIKLNLECIYKMQLLVTILQCRKHR